MSLSLAQMTTDVRQLLNESTATFWTDTEIQDWLAEGTRIIATKCLCIEDSDDITLVADQLTYTSSDHSWIADCLKPYALIYDDGSNNYKGIEMVHPKQLGNLLTFTSGPPRYYAFHNRRFYIWPLCSSTENGNTLTCLYAKESDDPTDLRDEFQHLAIQWAFARAKEKDHKFQEAGMIKQDLMQQLQFERQDKIAEGGEGTQALKTGRSTQR